jgi:hypothetical protein
MPTREEKIRERLFPKVQTYDRNAGGFAALPLILRRAQFLFEPRQWQIYSYIVMRGGPAGVAWFALAEMAWDLGYRSVSKLRPYIDSLVESGWLDRSSSQGRDYYIARDPVQVLRRMHKKKPFPPERQESLDELLESLRLRTLTGGPEVPAPPGATPRRARIAAVPVSPEAE